MVGRKRRRIPFSPAACGEGESKSVGHLPHYSTPEAVKDGVCVWWEGNPPRKTPGLPYKVEQPPSFFSVSSSSFLEHSNTHNAHDIRCVCVTYKGNFVGLLTSTKLIVTLSMNKKILRKSGKRKNMDTDVWNKKSRRQFGRLPSHSPSWRRRHFDNCQMFSPLYVVDTVAPFVSRLDVHGNSPRHFLPFGNTKNNKKETHICQQCVYARVCI